MEPNSAHSVPSGLCFHPHLGFQAPRAQLQTTTDSTLNCLSPERHWLQHKQETESKPPRLLTKFSIQNDMEAMVKKYQHKFRKVREDMDRWDQLQSRLLSQFRNASSIIERLQVLQDSKNYAGLKHVEGIEEAVLRNQMESLANILFSLKKTMEEFSGVVSSLDKIRRDGKMLVKGSSFKATVKQLQQRVGVKPSLADCLDSLMILHDMHHSEYLLKSSVVAALPTLALKPSASDLGILQQLLVDQPNIPKEEVQFIFDVIFAEEI